MSKKELKFDEALAQLTEVITKLESGSLPLEDSMELYKEGMMLSAECHKKLEKIEQDVVKLVDDSGAVSEFEDA